LGLNSRASAERAASSKRMHPRAEAALDAVPQSNPTKLWHRLPLRILPLRTITATHIIPVMAYIGTGVEYALHCLLWIAAPLDHRPSSRDLAELQGVSASFVAKIFQRLEKAGIVEAIDGIRGGYALARPPEKISVLDVIDAIEGRKALFDCQEVRARCVLFEGQPPSWATRGVCGIHAVMLRAERTLREGLAKTSLADLSAGLNENRLPPDFPERVLTWFATRQTDREDARLSAMRARRDDRHDAKD
jgi:Rrf2 family protein